MTCESCIQIIQPTVQPTVTQCIQVVQAAPTIVPPDTINVLVGGVQTVTYYSQGYATFIAVMFMAMGFGIGMVIWAMVD